MGGGLCDSSVTPSPIGLWIFTSLGLGLGLGLGGQGLGKGLDNCQAWVLPLTLGVIDSFLIIYQSSSPLQSNQVILSPNARNSRHVTATENIHQRDKVSCLSLEEVENF